MCSEDATRNDSRVKNFKKKESWASITRTWQCVLPDQETDLGRKLIKATKAISVDWKLNLNFLDLLMPTFDESAIGQKHHGFFHDLPFFCNVIRQKMSRRG
jgi:hypothetical protein